LTVNQTHSQLHRPVAGAAFPRVEGSAVVRVVSLEPAGEGAEEVFLPQEEAVTLMLNGRELVTLLASPGARRELAAGFLFCEGLVQDPAQFSELEEDAAGVRVTASGVDLALRLMEKRVIGSGCGKAAGFVTALDAFAAAARTRSPALPWVTAPVLCEAAMATYSGGALYRRTRGTHAAALFCVDGEQVALREDIGRHNAVDKVIGGCLLEGRPLADLFMVVTGRVSSDMVRKVARTRIPLVVSKSVPTDLAVVQAGRVHLGLVTCRGPRRLRVFSLPELVAPWS
jgi:FdhD protein